MKEIKYTETIFCPLCGFNKNKPIFQETFQDKEHKYALSINECTFCQLCYVSPRLSVAGLSQLYNDAYMEQTLSGLNHVNENVSRLEYAQFVKYLKQELPGGGIVLDVGCGVGLMLDAIAKDCPNVLAHGIELFNYAGQKAIEKGHNVRLGDIVQMDDFKSNSLDAIIILYVLEHMQDPIAVLKKCHSLLKESGKMFIAVPNYRYLKLTHTGIMAWFFYGKHSNLFPKEHLFNYTPKTITNMLNKSGFVISYFGQAKPLKTGTFIQRLLKLFFSIVFEILFKCGYQLGGIHIIAGKRQNNSISDLSITC